MHPDGWEGVGAERHSRLKDLPVGVADRALTRRRLAVGGLEGIPLHDPVIVASGGH